MSRQDSDKLPRRLSPAPRIEHSSRAQLHSRLCSHRPVMPHPARPSVARPEFSPRGIFRSAPHQSKAQPHWVHLFHKRPPHAQGCRTLDNAHVWLLTPSFPTPEVICWSRFCESSLSSDKRGAALVPLGWRLALALAPAACALVSLPGTAASRRDDEAGGPLDTARLALSPLRACTDDKGQHERLQRLYN